MSHKRGLVGLADLLRLLADQSPAPTSLCLDVTDQDWFGYGLGQPQPPTPKPGPGKRRDRRPDPTAEPNPDTRLRMPRVFTVTQVTALAAPPGPKRLPPAVSALALDDPRLVPPATHCLVRDEELRPKARLMPTLKRWLASGLPGALDERRLVDQVAHQQPLGRLPRVASNRWQPGLLVLLDLAENLWPYRFDMIQLARWLQQDAGAPQVVLRGLRDGPWGPWRPWAQSAAVASLLAPQPGRWPAAGGKVLIASDLGQTQGQAESPAAQAWLGLILALQRAGQEVVVLAPAGTPVIGAAPDKSVKVFRWRGDLPMRPVAPSSWVGAADESPALLDLLAMVAATRRTDPTLLRAFRHLLPVGRGDAGLEARVWAHPDVVSGGACWIRQGRARRHLQRFLKLPAPLQQQVDALCGLHHDHLPTVLQHEELLLRHQWGGEPLRQQLAQGAQVAGGFFRAMALRVGDPAFAHWGDVAHELLARLEADEPSQVPEPLRELADAVYADTANGAIPAWLALHRDETSAPAVPRWLVHDLPTGRVLLVRQPPTDRQRLLYGPLKSHSMDFRRGSAGARASFALAPGLPTVDFGPLDKLGDVEWRTPDESIRAGWVQRPRAAAGWRCGLAGVAVTVPPVHVPDGTVVDFAKPVHIQRLRSGLLTTPGPDEPAAVVGEQAVFRGPWLKGARVSLSCAVDESGVLASLQLQQGAGQARPEPPKVIQTLRYIEPGSFQMGSPPDEPGHNDDEGPRHPVTIIRGFWLADTPCTQALWQAVMGGKNPSHFKDGPKAADCPVEQVSWDGVQHFLMRLQALLPAGCEAVLPTEAEWEYASRAGSQTAYAWGDRPDAERANMDRKLGRTTPVKQYPANAWGLHDLQGNVWEWCADAPRPYRDRPEVDPSGGAGGDTRAVRGGSWLGRARELRSASRDRYRRVGRFRTLGFRVALRSPSPGGPGPVLPGGQDLEAGQRPAPVAGGSRRPAEPGGLAKGSTPTKKRRP